MTTTNHGSSMPPESTIGGRPFAEHNKLPPASDAPAPPLSDADLQRLADEYAYPLCPKCGAAMEVAQCKASRPGLVVWSCPNGEHDHTDDERFAEVPAERGNDDVLALVHEVQRQRGTRAASPAQEATPPRCKGGVLDLGDGHLCTVIHKPAASEPTTVLRNFLRAAEQRGMDIHRAEAAVAALSARCEDLECQPLVLITQRLAYAKALVDAQLCDAAEAERRALRTYPSPGGMVP